MNVCEHGDHEAPEGKRFCSRGCEECEHTESENGCAGLCDYFEPDWKARAEAAEAELSLAREVVEAARRMGLRFDRETYPMIAMDFEVALTRYDSLVKRGER